MKGLTKTLTRTVQKEYEDVNNADGRLSVACDAQGDHHRPLGPGTPSDGVSDKCFVMASADSGRDGSPAVDGTVPGATVRNFTVRLQNRPKA